MKKKRSRKLKNRRKQLIWKRRLGWLAIICLGLFLIILPPQLKIWRLEKQLHACQQQEQALQQKRSEVLKQIRYYSSDAYVEEVARQELGLVKPGEVPLLPAVPGHVQEPPKTHNQQIYE